MKVTSKILNILSIFTIWFSLITMSASYAQDAEKKVLEALPPHLEYRVDRRNSNLLPEGADIAQAVIERFKVWQPESFPVSVCFFGGSPGLKSKIANIALEWTKYEAKIPMDFGNLDNPRICSVTNPSDIKIGFAYPGYWSTVGQDSRDLVNPNEQSMNFQYWDVNPADEPEFTQTVLHEFGHALGLHHAHQNPWSSCEDEFNWDYIYKYLSGHPNYWNKAKVDRNMKKLHPANIDATAFDPNSIMLYTFEKEYYKNPGDSECYHEPNYSLSSQDLASVAIYYPDTTGAAIAARNEVRTEYERTINSLGTLSEDAKVRALSESQVLTKFEAPLVRTEIIGKLQTSVDLSSEIVTGNSSPVLNDVNASDITIDIQN